MSSTTKRVAWITGGGTGLGAQERKRSLQMDGSLSYLGVDKTF